MSERDTEVKKEKEGDGMRVNDTTEASVCVRLVLVHGTERDLKSSPEDAEAHQKMSMFSSPIF